jgi:hypothetical protein
MEQDDETYYLGGKPQYLNIPFRDCTPLLPMTDAMGTLCSLALRACNKSTTALGCTWAMLNAAI